jgi:hypothetical protein
MMEVLEGLGRNLRKEHALKLTLNCAMWGKVLTGYQYAKAAFHSYPYFPDSHSMTVVLLQVGAGGGGCVGQGIGQDAAAGVCGAGRERVGGLPLQ